LFAYLNQNLAAVRRKDENTFKLVDDYQKGTHAVQPHACSIFDGRAFAIIDNEEVLVSSTVANLALCTMPLTVNTAWNSTKPILENTRLSKSDTGCFTATHHLPTVRYARGWVFKEINRRKSDISVVGCCGRERALGSCRISRPGPHYSWAC
jgi:hypothetical protein